MRRFISFAVLLLCAIPFGVSVSGCSKVIPATFCNGLNSGVVVGQLTSLDLEPRLTGISLNQGEIGRINNPAGRDCKGNSSGLSNVIFASSNMTLADISPFTGAICAGTWNRNTGGGIPNYTVCTPTTQVGTAQLTASSEGVVSNPIPLYVHPIVTSIVLGQASTNCTTDPASNCAFDATQANGCGAPVAVTGYSANSCLSQGQNAQLVARTYKGTNVNLASNNISCQVGPLSFSALSPSVVIIDTNGLATAAQPGSSTINANISQSSSTAGFFSTCPPKSIVLSVPPSTSLPTGPVSVNQNTSQALTATVIDTKGATLTNISLQYISTNPTIIPAGGNVITPTYPGAASITAICLPPSCNPAPYNEIGLFNNGTPVVSNPVQITATGSNLSSVIYIGSTNSQYLLPIDFTVNTQSTPLRLPYAPNSMVLSEDQSTIYMGTPNEIMVVSVGSGSPSIIKQDVTLSGTVLAVSPDNNTIIVTDPVRKLIYLYLSSGGIATEYGGVATRAQFSADSQSVFITTTDQRLLVFSNFTGWTSIPLTTPATDVAVTIPYAGAYLGGTPIDVRSACPATTIVNPNQGFQQTTLNNFYPDLGPAAASADRIAATNDGVHILGATTRLFTDIKTNQKSGNCPITFTSNPNVPLPFTVAVPTSILNVIPTTDSAYAFVTYQGTGGVIPQYSVATGTLTSVPLQKTANGTPIAPLSGVITSDNNNVYIGTSGDNSVHHLTRGANGFTDNQNPILPALPGLNGGTAAPDLIVLRPRKTTS